MSKNIYDQLRKFSENQSIENLEKIASLKTNPTDEIIASFKGAVSSEDLMKIASSLTQDDVTESNNSEVANNPGAIQTGSDKTDVVPESEKAIEESKISEALEAASRIQEAETAEEIAEIIAERNKLVANAEGSPDSIVMKSASEDEDDEDDEDEDDKEKKEEKETEEESEAVKEATDKMYEVLEEKLASMNVSVAEYIYRTNDELDKTASENFSINLAQDLAETAEKIAFVTRESVLREADNLVRALS